MSHGAGFRVQRSHPEIKDRFQFVAEFGSHDEATDHAVKLATETRVTHRVLRTKNVIFVAYGDGSFGGRRSASSPRKTPPTFSHQHTIKTLKRSDYRALERARQVRSALDHFAPTEVDRPEDTVACRACCLPGKIDPRCSLCPSCKHAVEFHGTSMEQATDIDCDGLCGRERRRTL